MTSYWSRGRGGADYRYYQCYGLQSRECSGVGQVSADRLHHAVIVEAAALARLPWRLGRILEEARRRLPDVADARTDARKLRREVERLSGEKARCRRWRSARRSRLGALWAAATEPERCEIAGGWWPPSASRAKKRSSRTTARFLPEIPLPGFPQRGGRLCGIHEARLVR